MVRRERNKICLITPNHITTNPRLVKEAVTLSKAGYAVHIILTVSDPVGKALDWALLAEHPEWTYDVLDWSGHDREASVVRRASALLKKSAEGLFKLWETPLLAPHAVNRHYRWQLNKAVSAKANLYLAHNLEALPVAKAAAEYCGTVYGFDAEDFHRHDTSDDPENDDVRLKTVVENACLPGIPYFTAASPLIAEAYRQLFPTLQPQVLLNLFSKAKVKGFEDAEHEALRLLWFSQTVGENRGLELAVDAMGLLLPLRFEMHLLGNPQNGFKELLLQRAKDKGVAEQIFFHPPVPEDEIFHLAATCDIGLASETGVPLNRNICLTNKIFTYLQSGLALVASDTSAQAAFLRQNPGCGTIYRRTSVHSLAAVLRNYHLQRGNLLQTRRHNYEVGQHLLNWETEQAKLIALVEKTLWASSANKVR